MNIVVKEKIKSKIDYYALRLKRYISQVVVQIGNILKNNSFSTELSDGINQKNDLYWIANIQFEASLKVEIRKSAGISSPFKR